MTDIINLSTYIALFKFITFSFEPNNNALNGSYANLHLSKFPS